MNESVSRGRGWLGWLTGRVRRGRFQAEDLESTTDEPRGPVDSHEPPIRPIDVPTALCRELKDEALREAFHRLELPLRFLLYATVPGRETPSPEVCLEILKLWRQGLEREVRLVADATPGTVRFFEPKMEHDYLIRGRCRPGQAVRILTPCWRLRGEVIVRGEAEPFASASPAGERSLDRIASACAVAR